MRPRLAPLAVALAGVIVVIVAAVALVGGGPDPVRVPPAFVPTPPGLPPSEQVEPVSDPFSYDRDRRGEFEARATAGNAHVLYARSPGGVLATAERVARWRARVEEAAGAAGVEPDLLEALVFLESAGREDAMAAGGTEAAVGLTQILAETAQNLLGMKVDVRASARYTRRIARALRRGQLFSVQRLRVARARIDERYDPVKALAGTARYLRFARERLRTPEFALVSYHMGVGNLEGVVRAYLEDTSGRPVSELLSEHELPYVQVYFDSTPLRHPEAHERLSSLGDDSSNYLWKLFAAREIMRLWRSGPDVLRQAEAAQTAKNSAEEVLHPPGSTPAFGDPDALQAAWDRGELVAFPRDAARTGLRLDPRMGELAPRLERPQSLYRGLRPEALALALYMGAQVRAITGDPKATLTVSSTVRDGAYQRTLVRRNPEATQNFSLHTTGWAFDVLRRYRSRRHALAFQFVLDRLQALNVIAWVREPGAIHITASSDAQALLPLLGVLAPTGG